MLTNKQGVDKVSFNLGQEISSLSTDKNIINSSNVLIDDSTDSKINEKRAKNCLSKQLPQ